MNSNQPESFDSMPAADLVAYRDQQARWIEEQQSVLNLANAALSGRFVDVATAQYAAKEKESGQLGFVHDGCAVKAGISKTVQWDGDALKAIASEMDWGLASHYFDISFKMSEKIYNALPPGELRDKVTAARTTKLGAMSLKIAATES